MPTIVKPKPMRSLCPAATPGTPGSPAPITFQPGPTRCVRYRNDGLPRYRCGSFASSGLPVVVNAPLTTQLLEPTTRGYCTGPVASAYAPSDATVIPSSDSPGAGS